jgi:hypothetical protein
MGCVYSPVEAARLPLPLERSVAGFAKEVLEFATRRAQEQIQAELEDIAYERNHLAWYCDQLLDEIGTLEGEIQKLRTDIDEMRAAADRRFGYGALDAHRAAQGAREQAERERLRADEMAGVADGFALDLPLPGTEDDPGQGPANGAPQGDFEAFIRSKPD